MRIIRRLSLALITFALIQVSSQNVWAMAQCLIYDVDNGGSRTHFSLNAGTGHIQQAMILGAKLAAAEGKPLDITHFMMAAVSKTDSMDMTTAPLYKLMERLGIADEQVITSIRSTYADNSGVIGIEDGKLTIDEARLDASFGDTNPLLNVTTTDNYDAFIVEAHKASYEETAQKHKDGNLAFSNLFFGAEHIISSLVQSSGILGNTILARLGGNKKRALKTISDRTDQLRSDEARATGLREVNTDDSYNGVTFKTPKESSGRLPPTLRDMMVRYKDGQYPDVHIVESNVMALARALTTGRRSAQLVAEDGMGKRSTVIGLIKAIDIARNDPTSEWASKLPAELLEDGVRILDFDALSLMGSGETQYRGIVEQEVKKIIDIIESGEGKNILFADTRSGFSKLGTTEGSKGIGEQMFTMALKAKENRNEGGRLLLLSNPESAKEIDAGPLHSVVDRVEVKKPSEAEMQEVAEVIFNRIAEDYPVLTNSGVLEFLPEMVVLAAERPALGEHFEGVTKIMTYVAQELQTSGLERASIGVIEKAASKALDGAVVGTYVGENPANMRSIPIEIKRKLFGGESKYNAAIRLFQQFVVRVRREAEARDPLGVVWVLGPPGIGKTTTAYLIAKYGGFNYFKVQGSLIKGPGDLSRMLYPVFKANPRTLINFTEIDEASGVAEELGLAMGEDGYIRDPDTGRRAYTGESYWWMDTNVGTNNVSGGVFNNQTELGPMRRFGYPEGTNPKSRRDFERQGLQGEALERAVTAEEARLQAIQEASGYRPTGLVEFTEEGRQAFTEAVLEELGFPPKLFRRGSQAGGGIVAWGYFSEADIRAIGQGLMDSFVSEYSRQRGITLTYHESILETIVEHSLKPDQMDLGTSAVDTLLNSVLGDANLELYLERPDLLDAEGYLKDGARIFLYEQNGSIQSIALGPGEMLPLHVRDAIEAHNPRLLPPASGN